MANFPKVIVKLTNTQPIKLKPGVKNEPGTILTINKKKIKDIELPHESFIITRETRKTRNGFFNNMSSVIKFEKAKISKVIRSCGSFGSWLDNLGRIGTYKCCYFFS